MIEAAERVADRNGWIPELIVLRGGFAGQSRKTPARDGAALGCID
jgi:hypothetical protein